ncbi:hypothetical protein N0V88_007265 [Collariella sp. IMI 366227]|nr:hypothetical protein N0V88_007265 [Collariella sp. IMI 366227]
MGEPLTGDEHIVLRLESPEWPANESDGWGRGTHGTKIIIANTYAKSFLVMIPEPKEKYLEAQEDLWNDYQQVKAEKPDLAPEDLLKNFQVAFNPSLAFLWETDCSDYHIYCSRGSRMGGSSLPHRLIDVYAYPPRLVETGDPKFEPGKYVALSYCWGNAARFMTLKSNINEFLKELPYELPQTFSDAIYVTGALGYRYLWTDALCVIQDDNADLAREIVRMDKIYQNAIFTIAAQSAAGVADGLFNATMHPLARMACKIDFTATLRKPDQHGVGNAYFVLDTSTEPANYLSGRGWVLQESILAPRMLLFGAQMRWRCVEEEMSEIRPVPTQYYFIPPNSGFDESSESRTQSLRGHIYITDDDDTPPTATTAATFKAESACASWRQMVFDYTRRGLTFPTDVLRALVGLSRTYSEALRLTYLAGLWKESLIDDLAWFVDWETEHRTSPLPTKPPYWTGEMLIHNLPSLTQIRKSVPSWSWAAAGHAAISHRGPSQSLTSWSTIPSTPSHRPPNPQIISAFCLTPDPVHDTTLSSLRQNKTVGITMRAQLLKLC